MIKKNYANFFFSLDNISHIRVRALCHAAVFFAHSVLGFVLQVFLLSFCLIIFPSVNPFGRNAEQKELYTSSDCKLSEKKNNSFSTCLRYVLLIHMFRWKASLNTCHCDASVFIFIMWRLFSKVWLSRLSFLLSFHFCSRLPDPALGATRKHRCYILPWALRRRDSLGAPT